MKTKITTLACALALIAGSIPAQANFSNEIILDEYVAGAPEEEKGQEEQEQDQNEQEQGQEQEQGEEGQEFAEFDALSPDAQRRWNPRRPRARVATCFARNRLGRTFSIRGQNVNLRRLQAAAVQSCRRNSIFFIARTCQPIGCRINR